jgi:hypothetical protein
MEGGSHDITTPVPTTVASRADAWRLQGAGRIRLGLSIKRIDVKRIDAATPFGRDFPRGDSLNLQFGCDLKALDLSPVWGLLSGLHLINVRL